MIILGLGSNLGDRNAHLSAALEVLSVRLLDNVAVSSIIETPALMPEGAPQSWDINFLNMAMSGELKDEISPEHFLAELKEIEEMIGRKPAERWAPREIDIDILAWDDEIVDEDDLQIPHSALHKREFAYKPFLELAPNWVHPEFNQKLVDLVAEQ